MISQDERGIDRGIKLFEVLVQQKGVGEDVFQGAWQAVQAAMQNEHSNVRELGIRVFEELLKKLIENVKNRALMPVALQAAQVAVENSHVIYLGIRLFECLMEQKEVGDDFKVQVFQGALQASQAAMQNEHPNVRDSGIRLFEELLKQLIENVKNRALMSVALQAAQSAVTSRKSLGFKLFEVLVQQEGVGEDIFQGALQASQAAMKDDGFHIKDLGISLFRGLLAKLIENVKNQALMPVALQAAQVAVQHKNRDFISLGFRLFEVLVQQKGAGENIFNKALQVVQVAVQGEDWRFRESGISLLNVLFQALFEKGLFDQALFVAHEVIRNPDRNLRQYVIEIVDKIKDRKKLNEQNILDYLLN